MTGRMTNIRLDEISLVDYPAHMQNGFPIKKATESDSTAIFEALGKRNTNQMPTAEEIVAKGFAETPVEDIVKALAARDDASEFVKAFASKEKMPISSAVHTDSLSKKAKTDAAEEAAESDAEKAAELKKSAEDIYKGLAPELVAVLKERDEKLTKAISDAETAKSEASFEKAARLDREAIDVAKSDFPNLSFDVDVVAPALRKFAESDAESAAKITDMLKAVNGQADGTIFKELGTTASTANSGAKEKIDTIAKALVADGKSDNLPDAFTKAVADPANKALVDAYFNGDN